MRSILIAGSMCLVLGLGTCVELRAQVPTSFDIAEMGREDPAAEAQKELSKAQKALRKADKQRRKDAGAEKIRGILEDALEHAERAATLDPTLADAKVAKGRILLQLDRADEALTACNSAVTWAPELVEGHACKALAEARVVKGRILLQLDRADEALTACNSAVTWAPELVDGHACKALAEVALGRPLAAIASYDTIVGAADADPTDVEAAAAEVVTAIEAWLADRDDESAAGVARLRSWLAERG